MSTHKHLLEDPAFLADLAGDTVAPALAAKWGTGTTFIKTNRRIIRNTPAIPVVDRAVNEESSDGTKITEFIRDRPVTLDDARNWIRSTGDNPDDYTLSIRSIAYGNGLSSNRMAAHPKNGKADPAKTDLPALYAAARTKPRGPINVAALERATVVVFADPQIGKVGRRGGTPELLDRLQEKREKLSIALRNRKPARTALLDAGDGFEGFNSGGNPMFTNDLSLAEQMDVYGTELYSFVELMQRHGSVDVAAVCSNHTAWRNGKQNLGRPADDLGLYVHKQVSKVAAAAKIDATWHTPLPYDESVTVDVLGTNVGLVHGNQFGPGQSVTWWEKQTFGAGAVALADVLISGHYHTFSAAVGGRNPHTGRQRYSLGAPTLDNGSDWYRQTAGRDSDPGLLIFDITPNGFDLSSMTVL